MPDWSQLNGTPEQIAAFRAEYEASRAELQRRIKSGELGDQAREISGEDEAILDAVWAAPIEELEDPEPEIS